MSRAGTFVALGIIIIAAVYSRQLAMEIIGPGSLMWSLVVDIQYAGINGEEWAEEMYVNITVWVPWLIVGAGIAGAVFREFRRQNVTTARVRR
jgi:hypothetical protein